MYEKIRARYIHYVSTQSSETLFGIGLLGALIVGVIDYLSGPELAVSIFYLLPVCFVSKYVGRRRGMVLAGFCGIAWLVAEMMWQLRYSHPLIPFWNAAVRCALFLVSGALTAEVAERKAVEERLRRQTDILQSILNSMADGVIVCDRSGKMILFNPAAERLLGRGLSDLSVEQWIASQVLYLPDALTAIPKDSNPIALAARGEPTDAEVLLHHSESGKETWLRITSRPLLSGTDRSAGAVVVFSDITAHKTLEKQIAEISDREQRRIGQDLHDGLCQHLVSTAFASAILRQKLEEARRKESDEAEHIVDLINEGIAQARTLARGLYPVRLDADGLASALEELAASTATLTRIECTFECEDTVSIDDFSVANNLYRIAQEAVNNAVKHSKAHAIVITLESVEEEVTLTVRDDGIGLPPNADKARGMGLHIMNYRARLIGASLDIRRGRSGGTTVSCSFLNENRIQTGRERVSTNH